MTKDYAKKRPKNKSAKRREPSLPTKTILITFCFIALLVTGLYYLTHLPSLQKSLSSRKTVTKTVKKQTSKAKIATIEKPQFEFYNILQENNADQRTHDNANDAATRKNNLTDPKNYILQVASYKQFNDADRLKASLILSGYNANVRATMAMDQQWYRVYLGPNMTKSHAEKLQQRLRDEHIDSILLKIS